MFKLRGPNWFECGLSPGVWEFAMILQGLLRLLEPEVIVRCREIDRSVVESVLSAAATKYSNILETEAGIKKSVKLSLDKSGRYLPPPPSNDSSGHSWWVTNSALMLPTQQISRLHVNFASATTKILRYYVSATFVRSSGGVVLITPDGRISCDNTLDARLKMVVAECAPSIRMNLFTSSSKDLKH